MEGGTIVLADQTVVGFSQPDRLPRGVIDKKYQILGLFGEGGMGAVFRAHHLMLDKDVALKTFKSKHLTEGAHARFEREAQAIAKLNHKNVVQVFDFGLAEDGVPYYTMENLLGETLAERIKNTGPLPIAEAIDFFTQICHGHLLAHSKGIIHRDLKPANLFIEKIKSAKGNVDVVKILDFGIASLTDQSVEEQTKSPPSVSYLAALCDSISRLRLSLMHSSNDMEGAACQQSWKYSGRSALC